MGTNDEQPRLIMGKDGDKVNRIIYSDLVEYLV